MPERLPPSESSSETNPKNRIAFVDTSHLVDSESRDLAERRMIEDKESQRGVGGILKKIWKHDLFREYYRQKEIYRAKEELMEGGGNLYAEADEEKHQHSVAMQSVTERFMSDYEETVHQGEEKEVLESNEESEEVRQNIKELIKMYASGSIDDEQFAEERLKILSALQESNPNLVSAEYVHADNFLAIAQNAKESVKNGKALEELDLDFEIILGRARSGIRTETERTVVDSIVEKLSKTRASALLHESTIAAAVAGAYSLGAFASKRLTSSKMFAWGTFGATAFLGGAVAATRENKRFKEERVHHIRELAKGRSFAPEGDAGREEIDSTRYETRDVQELMSNLEAVLYGGEGEVSEMNEERFNVALAMLVEIESRVNVSDSRNVDLISFSAPHLAEQERLKLDILRAQAKVDLRKFAEGEDSFLSEEFDSILGGLVTTKEFDLENGVGGIESKDRVFDKMKKRKVAGAFVKGVATGIVIGGTVQELTAMASDEITGITEGHIKSRTGGEINTTPLETLRRLFEGELKVSGTGTVPYSIGGHEIAVPPGMDVVPLRDGSVNFQFGDRLIASNVSFNPDGTLSDEVRQAIENRGITVIEDATLTSSGDVVTKIILENPDTVTSITPPIAVPVVLRKTLKGFEESKTEALPDRGLGGEFEEGEAGVSETPEDREGYVEAMEERGSEGETSETGDSEIAEREPGTLRKEEAVDRDTLLSLGLDEGASKEEIERAINEILTEHQSFVKRMHPALGSQEKRSSWEGYEDEMNLTYEAMRAYGKISGAPEGEVEDHISKLRDADILGIHPEASVADAKKAHSEIREHFLQKLEKIEDKYSSERNPIDLRLLEAYEALRRFTHRKKPKTGIEKIKDWNKRGVEVDEEMMDSDKDVQLSQAQEFLSQLEEMSKGVDGGLPGSILGPKMEELVDKIGLLAWSLEKKGLEKKEARKIEGEARDIFEKTTKKIFSKEAERLHERTKSHLQESRVAAEDVNDMKSREFKKAYDKPKGAAINDLIEENGLLKKGIRDLSDKTSVFNYGTNAKGSLSKGSDVDWLSDIKDSLEDSDSKLVAAEQIISGMVASAQERREKRERGEEKTENKEKGNVELEELVEQVKNLREVIFGTKPQELVVPEAEAYLKNMEGHIKKAKKENDPDEGDNRKIVRGMEREWRSASALVYKISSRSLLSEVLETEKTLDEIHESLKKGEETLKEINERFSELGGGNIQNIATSLQERSVHAIDELDKIGEEMMRIAPEKVQFWPKKSTPDRNAIKKNIERARKNSRFVEKKTREVFDLVKNFELKKAEEPQEQEVGSQAEPEETPSQPETEESPENKPEEGLEHVDFQEAVDDITGYTDDLLDISDETNKDNFLEKNEEMQKILQAVRQTAGEVGEYIEERKMEARKLIKTDPDQASEILRQADLEKAQIESRVRDAESVLEAVTSKLEI